MAYIYKQIKYKFFELFPILVLFFISLNGNSILDLRFFSVNIHYILVYFYILRQPDALGYGFIFLSGIISDVVYGSPLGVNSLSLLVIAAVAAYVRVVTVRITLINDWISFIPALLIANLVYFLSLYYSEYAIDYIYLFKNSISTFVFYPILWGLFSLISRFFAGSHQPLFCFGKGITSTVLGLLMLKILCPLDLKIFPKLPKLPKLPKFLFKADSVFLSP